MKSRSGLKVDLQTKVKELFEEYGEIKIMCTGTTTLPIDVIFDFQKNLKHRSKYNLLKLITSIFKLGFSAPFFIWDHLGDYYCLDGHGRIEALSAIREIGIPIPGLFPVVFIEAETEEEARAKLLTITSQYGEFDLSELDEWISGIDDSIKEIINLSDYKEEKIIEFKEKNIIAKNCINCPKCGFKWEE